MKNKPRGKESKPLRTAAEEREMEARRKLARPPKDKTEVTIGPTDRSGPDVVLE
jgi:hypothetical protein